MALAAGSDSDELFRAMYGHIESKINFWRTVNLGTGGAVSHLNLVMSSHVFEQLWKAKDSLALSFRANLGFIVLLTVLAEVLLFLSTCWSHSPCGVDYLAGLWAA